MYGENTKTIAIPIYRVLPYPVMKSYFHEIFSVHFAHKIKSFKVLNLNFLMMGTPKRHGNPSVYNTKLCKYVEGRMQRIYGQKTTVFHL